MEKSWDKYELWSHLTLIPEKHQILALRECGVDVEYGEEVQGWIFSSIPEFIADKHWDRLRDEWNWIWDKLEFLLDDIEEFIMEEFEIYDLIDVETLVRKGMKELALKKSLGGDRYGEKNTERVLF